MKVLVADNDPTVLKLCCATVNRCGHEAYRASNGTEALRLFSEHAFPVILTDLEMPGMDGAEWLRRFNECDSPQRTRVIVLNGHARKRENDTFLRERAFECLNKPVVPEILRDALSRAVVAYKGATRIAEQRTDRFESTSMEADIETKHGICIASEHMRDLVKLSLSFHQAPSATVLIQGETGTGKEKIARLIHEGIEGDGRPFIDLNCAAISPHLLESELFGYEGGAFTGARPQGQPGKFELADGGTLLLDEIGEMPLQFQCKLLRVLEQREVRRVGGIRNKRINTRIICATNCDLTELVRQKQFRSDLFHRLNVGYIRLKPLRERKEEIAPLAHHFLRSAAQNLRKPFRSITSDAIEALKRYDWPGNTRELRNTIERAVLLHNDATLRGEHLNFLCAEEPEAQEEPSAPNTRAFQAGGVVLPNEGFNLEQFEQDILIKALQLNGENKSRTARYLGLTRSKLLSRLSHIHC